MHALARSPEWLVRRLAVPQGGVQVVIDTDAFNEIDDQFAIAYALASSKHLRVKALYAAPFRNRHTTDPGEGMEKSYREIIKIVELFGQHADSIVFRGAQSYLPKEQEAVSSAAAEHLVNLALAASEDEPLYVVAIGAPTNVASAILMEPAIIGKIVVIWLGGHAFHWPHTKEFNLFQDMKASRVLLNSGVPLVLIPCLGVASHLSTTLAEVEAFLRGRGAVGDYLYETFRACREDHFGASRILWDLAPFAYLMGESFVHSHLTHSPLLNDGYTWSFDPSRSFIRYCDYVYRDTIFKHFFAAIASHADSTP